MLGPTIPRLAALYPEFQGGSLTMERNVVAPEPNDESQLDMMMTDAVVPYRAKHVEQAKDPKPKARRSAKQA